MKKTLVSFVLALSMLISSAYADTFENTLKTFDFTKGEDFEYSVISGDWSLEEPGKSLTHKEDFQGYCGRFSPISGNWVQDGEKYIQNLEIVSYTTRSIYDREYESFSFSSEVYPMSEENTLMIYFGYKSEKEFCSIEINSYQSKLIFKGEEFVGAGSIVKDKKYNVRLDYDNGDLTLYCDGNAIFNKEISENLTGKIGLGTWNSRIAFDNMEITPLSPLGNKRLLKGKNGAVIFNSLQGDKISANVAAESIYAGDIGVLQRANSEGNGYYGGINRNYLYIAKKIEGKKTILEKKEFNPRSQKYWEIALLCDGDTIKLILDGEEYISVKDSEFADGSGGIFADGTSVYCKNVSIDTKDYSDVSPEFTGKTELVQKLGVVQLTDKNPTNKELAFSVGKLTGQKLSVGGLYSRGYSRSELKPEEEAKAEDIIYAMVKILGYPTDNYKKYASEAGLYKGAAIKSGYTDNDSFVRIIYNTLTAERMKIAGISGDKITFEKNGTILEDVFNIKRVTGIALADNTAYIGDTPYYTGKGEFLVNGIYVTADFDTKDYLGRGVEGYLKFEEGNDFRAEAVCISLYKTEETKAVSQYIDGATTNRELVWRDRENGRIRRKNIDENATVIKNGERIGKIRDLEALVLTPSEGEVILIDNNSDNHIDAVMVWDYTPYVIDHISLSNNRIYDKIRGTSLDLEDTDYTIYKDGKKKELSDLKEFDVISTVTSGDELVIKCTNAEPVRGIYERDGYGVFIGNDEYSLSNWCDISAVKNGDTVTAYLDMYNRPVYMVKKQVTGYDYGYISSIKFDEGEEDIYIKLYSFSEGVKRCVLADKVTVDFGGIKEKYYKYKQGDNSFKVLSGLLNARCELVKFRTNADDKINQIIFPVSGTGENIPDNKDTFKLYFGSYGEPSGFRVGKFLQSKIESKYRITENTKIISIEENPKNPEKFKRLSLSELTSDNDYNVMVYDVNERFEANVLILEDASDWYTKFGSVVADAKTIIDEQGDEVLELKVYTLGEEKLIYADNPDMLSNGWIAQRFENKGTKLSQIDTGDVIYYCLGADGKITSFAVLHKNNGGEFYNRSNYGWGADYIPNAAMAVTYCRIIRVYGDMFVADIGGAKPVENNNPYRNYYIVERNRMRKASFSDIEAGDKIVGLWKWANLNDLIIYR